MSILNNKQEQALMSMKNGKNIFLTGPGGSGKSHVINLFVKYFKNEKENDENKAN